MDNQAYSLSFARVGEDVVIWPMAKIVSPGTISIGDSVIVDDFVLFMGGRLSTLHSFIHIGSFTSITGGGELCMEDFSGLSSGVRIYTGNEDYTGGCLTNPAVPAPYREPVRSFVHLGRHCIVGANSVVLPGVTIGEGAAVGACSLVLRDLKPWTIYAGSPCREIGPRPKDEILGREARLRKDLYDSDGKYIPKSRR
jgi:galactoside O-acetyltransferase